MFFFRYLNERLNDLTDIAIQPLGCAGQTLTLMEDSGLFQVTPVKKSVQHTVILKRYKSSHKGSSPAIECMAAIDPISTP